MAAGPAQVVRAYHIPMREHSGGGDVTSPVRCRTRRARGCGGPRKSSPVTGPWSSTACRLAR